MTKDHLMTDTTTAPDVAGTTVSVQMPLGSAPHVYAAKSAAVIQPGERLDFITIAKVQLVALRGFVWTSPKGPIGPTFDLPIEEAHEGKIKVEILIGAMVGATKDHPGAFVPQELPNRRLQQVRDVDGQSWMFAVKIEQESVAHAPTLSYEPLECAVQVAFVNQSEAPLSLPMAGLFVYCVPYSNDEPSLQIGAS